MAEEEEIERLRSGLPSKVSPARRREYEREQLRFAIVDGHKFDMTDPDIRAEVEKRQEQIRAIQIFNYNFDRIERQKILRGEAHFDPVPVAPKEYYAIPKEQRPNWHESIINETARMESGGGDVGGSVGKQPHGTAATTRTTSSSKFEQQEDEQVAKMVAKKKTNKDPRWWRYDVPLVQEEQVRDWSPMRVMEWAEEEAKFPKPILHFLEYTFPDGQQLVALREEKIDKRYLSEPHLIQLLLKTIAELLVDGGVYKKTVPIQDHAGLYEVIGRFGAVVRKDYDTNSEKIGKLDCGLQCTVKETIGRRAHIVDPLDGWASVCTSGDYNLILSCIKKLPPQKMADILDSVKKLQDHHKEKERLRNERLMAYQSLNEVDLNKDTVPSGYEATMPSKQQQQQQQHQQHQHQHQQHQHQQQRPRRREEEQLFFRCIFSAPPQRSQRGFATEQQAG